MLSMAMDSAKLFLSGKLFQNYSQVFTKLAIGVVCGLVAFIVGMQFLPLWVAAVLGGAVSGFLQPVLFKNLKYA